MLWKATSTTYVKSEHPDGYFSDTYYGTASVRGADRVKRNNMIYYYDWTQITYDVQGDIYKTRADSYGKNNPNQIIREITVKDKWNLGPKTKVYYNYSEKTLGSYYNSYNINRDINVNAHSDSEQNIKGGLLMEGEIIIEDVEILEEGVDKLNTKFNVE
ncbi:hypothetical protein [Helcococcus bovis]|uniref:hypothetical protein n=1 Tax=Helcococcus bovis TaxID=3153252 RepID=UPI0038B6F62D